MNPHPRPYPSSHHHHHELTVPRGPLLGAATLIGATLIAVAAVRWSGMDISTRSQAPVLAERALHFVDRADGGIEVRDGSTRITTVAAGEDGFLRGALRALVRERRQFGIGATQPFVLRAHGDGRLSLEDPATGQRIDLESFGPSNAQRFARLLAQPAAAPGPTR